MVEEKRVTFQACFKQEIIKGYMYVDEADDETPLRFYDSNCNESWYVPSNPNDMDLQADWWANYDYLSTVFQETDIITLLCDFQDKSKVFILETTNDGDSVILIINGELTRNSIDEKWKIVSDNGFAFGDGETIEEAIASATLVATNI